MLSRFRTGHSFLLLTFYTLLAVQNAVAQERPLLYQGDASHSGVTNSKPLMALKGVKFAFKTEGAIRTMPAVWEGFFNVFSLAI